MAHLIKHLHPSSTGFDIMYLLWDGHELIELPRGRVLMTLLYLGFSYQAEGHWEVCYQQSNHQAAVYVMPLERVDS